MHHRMLMLGVAAAVTAGPAVAATTLTVDGAAITAATSGWIDPGGTAATPAPTSPDSRAVFSFVLGSDGLYNRAEFHGDAAGMVSESRLILTYSLHDAAPLPVAPTAETPVPPAAVAAAYVDAGSGTVYGTATVVVPAGGDGASTPVVIALNTAGLAALNAASAAATPFAVGLSVVAHQAPAAGTVPEPSAWLLMLSGFGLVGGTRRAVRPRAPA